MSDGVIDIKIVNAGTSPVIGGVIDIKIEHTGTKLANLGVPSSLMCKISVPSPLKFKIQN